MMSNSISLQQPSRKPLFQQYFSNFNLHKDSPGGLVKMQSLLQQVPGPESALLTSFKGRHGHCPTNPMGPDPVNMLPLSYRPLPHENPTVVLGLHILISLEDVWVLEKLTARCRPHNSLLISLYITVSQILTTYGKYIHIYTSISLFIVCLPHQNIQSKRAETCVSRSALHPQNRPAHSRLSELLAQGGNG